MTTPTDADREAAERWGTGPVYNMQHLAEAFAAHRLAGQRQANEAKGWQDIATAPRDGRVVLVFGGTRTGKNVRSAWYHEEAGMWACTVAESNRIIGVLEPTHWMPLPAAPEAVGQ